MDAQSTIKKHTVTDNLKYVMSVGNQYGYRVKGPMIWYMIASLLSSALTMVMPAAIIALLEQQVPTHSVATVVVLLTIGLSLCAFSATVLSASLDKLNQMIRVHSFYHLTLSKYVNTDYEHLLSQPFNQALQNTFNYALGGDDTGAGILIRHVRDVLLTFISLLGFSIYASFQVPMVLPLVLISVGVTFLITKMEANYRYQTMPRRDALSQKIWRLNQTVADLSNAKDIRGYEMDQWLSEHYDHALVEQDRFNQSINLRSFLSQGLNSTFLFVRDLIIFAFLLKQLQSGLSVAMFVLIYNILAQLNSWTTQLAKQSGSLQHSSSEVDHLRSFLDYPERIQHAKRIDVPDPRHLTICFEDVSYRYPETDKDTLSHLSFTLHAGEKLALVGNNGAGKSTIVQLMLGLLRPTGGHILFNGVDIAEMAQDQLADYVIPVFQSTPLWAQTIAQSVSMRMDEQIDRVRVNNVLNQVGLHEKIITLPKGLDTPLTRNVEPDGINFSGGELQKLMLARALYQGAPAILLDEPTAALDAIAEQEVYREYEQLFKGCTSLFISHRLASTRFCDRIILLGEGNILQEGSHEDLVHCDGPYQQMYQLQSQYYTQGGDQDVCA